MFLYISIVKETEMAWVDSSTKTQARPLPSESGIREGNDIIFLFPNFFLVPQKDENFLRHHNEV